MKSQITVITRRIRLTRSVFLDGEHAEKGSVHEVAKAIALDLIAQSSAVPVRSKWWTAAACAAICIGLALLCWIARVRW